jgi:hypothetical protein
MGEEPLELGEDITALAFLQILGDRHHGICLEAVLVSLALLIFNELSINEIPGIIGVP